MLGDLHGFERQAPGLPVDESPLMDILCLAAPIVADADPAMVRRMLDPETYRRRVTGRPGHHARGPGPAAEDSSTGTSGTS